MVLASRSLQDINLSDSISADFFSCCLSAFPVFLVVVSSFLATEFLLEKQEKSLLRKV